MATLTAGTRIYFSSGKSATLKNALEFAPDANDPKIGTITWSNGSQQKVCLLGNVAKPKPTTKAPSVATMERWISNGVAKATDGCRVEPDGTCPHGHESWIMKLGCI